MEALSGLQSGVDDPFARYESDWQQLQENQAMAIEQAISLGLAALTARDHQAIA